MYQMGLFFALCSGQEHHRLQHVNYQVKLFEPPGDRPYFFHHKDKSKTNQGGIKHTNETGC